MYIYLLLCILFLLIYLYASNKQNVLTALNYLGIERNIDKFNSIKLNNFLNYESKIIHIWQGERDDNKLLFMYKPIVSSIIKLLEYSNNDILIDYKINYYNFNEINPGEILIWIGCENIPDFNLLKNRSIYTIYYNSEPDIDNFDADEIWTYSKYLFNNYKKNNDLQIIKFVPIICEENIPIVPYNLKTNDIKLIFIGLLSYRNDKKNILFQNSFIKNNLEEVYNLWNDNDFNNYISNKPNIYLNLKKTNTDALPSVRINKLLSHKCIIISEHTNDIDEEYYKNIIYFCNIDEIENIYRKLINKTNIKLQEEADRIYETFYNKFYYKNAVDLIIQK